jgi:hypothetical protein
MGYHRQPQLDVGTFCSIYRYMAKAAMDKRAVQYIELQSVFGVSRADIWLYTAELGNYCVAQKLPPLNALVIDAVTGGPNKEGFESWWQDHYDLDDLDWGAQVAECWRHYNVPGARKATQKHLTGSGVRIRAWHKGRDADLHRD